MSVKAFKAQCVTYVSGWKLEWSRAPRGKQGSAWVRATVPEAAQSKELSKELQVQWIRDAQGIRLILENGIHEFDLQSFWQDGEMSSGQVHHVWKRNSNLEWHDVRVSLGEQELKTASRSMTTGTLRVKAQMPGKIVKILIEVGALVQKDQPLILMEAMKMENEIRAPRVGRVSQVKVVAGQAVDSGAELIVIEDAGT